MRVRALTSLLELEGLASVLEVDGRVVGRVLTNYLLEHRTASNYHSGRLKVPCQLFVANARLSTVLHRTFRCSYCSHANRPKSLNKHVPCDVPCSKGLQGVVLCLRRGPLDEMQKASRLFLSFFLSSRSER